MGLPSKRLTGGEIVRKILRKIKRKLRKYLGKIWLGVFITCLTGFVLGFLNPIAWQVVSVLLICYFGLRILISEDRTERLFCLAWFVLAVLLAIF